MSSDKIISNKLEDLKHHLSSLFFEYGCDDEETLIEGVIEIIEDVLGVNFGEDKPIPQNKDDTLDEVDED